MHPEMPAAHIIDLIKLEVNFWNLLTFSTLQTVVNQLLHRRKILVPGAAFQHVLLLTSVSVCMHELDVSSCMFALHIHEHTSPHAPWKQVSLHVRCEEVNIVGSSNGGVDRVCLHAGKNEVCKKELISISLASVPKRRSWAHVEHILALTFTTDANIDVASLFG